MLNTRIGGQRLSGSACRQITPVLVGKMQLKARSINLLRCMFLALAWRHPLNMSSSRSWACQPEEEDWAFSKQMAMVREAVQHFFEEILIRDDV